MDIDWFRSLTGKEIRLMERKWSSGFRRIFTVDLDRLFKVRLCKCKWLPRRNSAPSRGKKKEESYCKNTTKPSTSFSFHDPEIILGIRSSTGARIWEASRSRSAAKDLPATTTGKNSIYIVKLNKWSLASLEDQSNGSCSSTETLPTLYKSNRICVWLPVYNVGSCLQLNWYGSLLQ